MKALSTCIVCIFCLFFFSNINAQAIVSIDEYSLAGVREMNVVVEELNSELKGLTKNQIQTDVELRLRRVGIRVDKNSIPFLYINLNTSRHSKLPLFIMNPKNWTGS